MVMEACPNASYKCVVITMAHCMCKMFAKCVIDTCPNFWLHNCAFIGYITKSNPVKVQNTTKLPKLKQWKSLVKRQFIVHKGFCDCEWHLSSEQQISDKTLLVAFALSLFVFSKDVSNYLHQFLNSSHEEEANLHKNALFVASTDESNQLWCKQMCLSSLIWTMLHILLFGNLKILSQESVCCIYEEKCTIHWKLYKRIL